MSESALRRIEQSRGPRDPPSPRRRHGVLAKAEDSHDSLWLKNQGMGVGMQPRTGGLEGGVRPSLWLGAGLSVELRALNTWKIDKLSDYAQAIYRNLSTNLM